MEQPLGDESSIREKMSSSRNKIGIYATLALADLGILTTHDIRYDSKDDNNTRIGGLLLGITGVLAIEHTLKYYKARRQLRKYLQNQDQESEE